MARIVLAMGGQKVVRTLPNNRSNDIVAFFTQRIGKKPVDVNDPSKGERDATLEEVIKWCLDVMVGPYIDHVHQQKLAVAKAEFDAEVAAINASVSDVSTAD